jgi:hypothetical protein
VLTFAGGLASTVFIPITQWLVEVSGWRGRRSAGGGESAGVRALHALLPGRRAWPAGTPRWQDRRGQRGGKRRGGKTGAAMAIRRALASLQFWTLAIAYTGYALIVGTLGVHLIPLLGAKGFSTGEVVRSPRMVGLMQVAGRLAQVRAGRRGGDPAPVAHRVRDDPGGDGNTAAVAGAVAVHRFLVVFYGVGIGISTILRGIFMPSCSGARTTRRSQPALRAQCRRARRWRRSSPRWIVAAFDTYEALIWANLVIALAALGAMWIATRRKV